MYLRLLPCIVSYTQSSDQSMPTKKPPTENDLFAAPEWMDERLIAWMMECDWLDGMTKGKDVNRIRMLTKKTFWEGSESLHVVAMRHSKFH